VPIGRGPALLTISIMSGGTPSLVVKSTGGLPVFKDGGGFVLCPFGLKVEKERVKFWPLKGGVN